MFKPRLVTFGLSTCVGLAVVSDNFAFLVHLDMGGLVGNSFDIKWIPLGNGKYDVKSTKCIATEQLMNVIRKRKEQITSPLSVQLVFGGNKSQTVEFAKERLQLLYQGLDDVFGLCQNLGIAINKIPDGVSSTVTVDSKSGSILLGSDYGRDDNYGSLKSRLTRFLSDKKNWKNIKIYWGEQGNSIKKR